jgi:hypothetical protein
MPRKKPPATPATKPAKVNKSAWIRSLPASMKAKEVVAVGKAKGIKLSVGQVYVARASAKKKPGKRGPGRPRKNAAPVAAAASGVEGLLRAAAAEIGLSRAIEILSEQRDAVRKVLGS